MDIFLAGINAVLPKILIKNNLQITGNQLRIKGNHFNLHKNVYVVGFGKAVLGLAINLFTILEDHIVEGVISTPTPDEEDFKRHPNLFRLPDNAKRVFEIYYGPRNNLPDKTVLSASNRIYDLASTLKSDDILLTLITGGGSALLCRPADDSIHLKDIVDTTKLLAKSGATIEELNTVRAQLDQLKSGGLARAAHSCQVISLILSDVIGDDIATIASGPTALSNHFTIESCLKIFQEKGITDQMPHSVLKFLRNKVGDKQPAIDAGTSISSSPYNFLIGSNSTSLLACREKATVLGYECFVLSHSLSGDATGKAKLLADLVRLVDTKRKEGNILELLDVLKSLEASDCVSTDLINFIQKSPKKSLCILIGGETTVKVANNIRPDSRGGRCTHMALAAALHWRDHSYNNSQVKILFGATDGMDGATDGAGAWITPRCIDEVDGKFGLNAAEYFNNFNSYSLFKYLSSVDCVSGGLVSTGLTGTNVMDIIVITVDYPW